MKAAETKKQGRIIQIYPRKAEIQENSINNNIEISDIKIKNPTYETLPIDREEQSIQVVKIKPNTYDALRKAARAKSNEAIVLSKNNKQEIGSPVEVTEDFSKPVSVRGSESSSSYSHIPGSNSNSENLNAPNSFINDNLSEKRYSNVSDVKKVESAETHLSQTSTLETEVRSSDTHILLTHQEEPSVKSLNTDLSRNQTIKTDFKSTNNDLLQAHSSEVSPSTEDFKSTNNDLSQTTTLATDTESAVETPQNIKHKEKTVTLYVKIFVLAFFFGVCLCSSGKLKTYSIGNKLLAFINKDLRSFPSFCANLAPIVFSSFIVFASGFTLYAPFITWIYSSVLSLGSGILSGYIIATSGINFAVIISLLIIGFFSVLNVVLCSLSDGMSKIATNGIKEINISDGIIYFIVYAGYVIVTWGIAVGIKSLIG